jgi:hypothetical protein
LDKAVQRLIGLDPQQQPDSADFCAASGSDFSPDFVFGSAFKAALALDSGVQQSRFP